MRGHIVADAGALSYFFFRVLLLSSPTETGPVFFNSALF